VTVQVGGIGTMAGPPARATRLEMVAGRAPVVAATAAVKSRLVMVEVRILRFGGAVRVGGGDGNVDCWIALEVWW
jgi:hypothetical protein